MKRWKALLALSGLACTMVSAFSVPAAHADPAYNVFVGYADDLRASATQSPNPWAGSPGVTFDGITSGTTDAGAVRIANATAVSETVDFVTVEFPGCTFDLWHHGRTLPGFGQLIVTQTQAGATSGCPGSGTITAPSTMDTSDIGPGGSSYAGNCAQSHVIPLVHVSVNGVLTTYSDTGQVLNTGGVDAASCSRPGFPAGNETTQWVSIGQPPCATGADLSLSPATQTHPVGTTATVTATFSACGSPLQGATVDFSVTSGPNSPKTMSILTNPSGQAQLIYTGTGGVGTDIVNASVTNPSTGGKINADSAVKVNWIKASPNLTTTPSGPTPQGGNASDSAKVTGGDSPTGSVSFSLYGPSDTMCQTALATVSGTLSGGSASSGPVPVGAAGTYNWVATYSGDALNNSVTSLCGAEPQVVTAQTLTGRAFGLSASAAALGIQAINIAPTPDTGNVSTTASSTTSTPCVANLTGLINAAVLCANVTTTAFPGKSVATASVANANVGLPLVPTITVHAVNTSSTTTCASSSGSTTIDYLQVGSTPIITSATNVAPNSHITIGGISLVLNEQIPFTGSEKGLTVNGVDITINLGFIAQARIIIASAQSDIGNCP